MKEDRNDPERALYGVILPRCRELVAGVVIAAITAFTAVLALAQQPTITAPPLGSELQGRATPAVGPPLPMPAMNAMTSPAVGPVQPQSLDSLPQANDVAHPSSRRSRRGDDLVRQASARLAEHKTIQARLRQTVNMFGQSVVGTGAYHQSRRGSDLLLRLDLQLQLDDRAATFQQISDGRYLWRFQDSPDIQKLGAFEQELSRVDLDVVRRATPKSGESGSLSATTFGGIGYGGLPQLTRQLVHHFTFDVPQSATWQNEPVWILNGSWYEPSLRRVMSNYSQSKSDESPPPKEFSRLLSTLPAQFPHHVVLILGKEDLFPYRITYRRKTSDDTSGGIIVTSNTKEIVTLDLFQVQYDSPIAPSQFVRRAGELPVVDATEHFLNKHGLVYREAKKSGPATKY